MSDRMPEFIQPSLKDPRLGRPLIVRINLGSRSGGVAWIR